MPRASRAKYSREWRARNREKIKEYNRKARIRNKAKERVRREKFKELKNEAIDKYKSEKGCMLCGEKDPLCLDFHHKPGTKKRATISRMINSAYKPICIWNEIKQCDLLCANCHRKLHGGNRKTDYGKKRKRKEFMTLFGIYNEIEEN